MTVSLIIANARVRTGDPRRPWADAIAIAGDRIKAVGSSAEIRKFFGDVRVIDAQGKMVVPGAGGEAGGVLKSGMPADFSMIDSDHMEIGPDGVRGPKTVLTVIGGLIVYEAADS